MPVPQRLWPGRSRLRRRGIGADAGEELPGLYERAGNGGEPAADGGAAAPARAWRQRHLVRDRLWLGPTAAARQRLHSHRDVHPAAGRLLALLALAQAPRIL